MNTLRLEFQELQQSKFSGTELLFETSNNKYIEWLEQKINNDKLRIDVRNTKRGRIIQSFWCTSCDHNLYRNKFVDVYQYFGKRLFKVASFKPSK